MPVTIAFDVYGTLIDTRGVISMLQELAGSNAESISQTWRDKQLEYSFRRGLMQNYQNFAVCTSQALDYACSFHKIGLTSEQRNALLDRYSSLPAFRDAKTGLTQMKNSGFQMYAFSNGSANAVETLLAASGIRDFFAGVISTDDVRSFKPNPAVYCHFLRESNAAGSHAWLVSSNPFDVIGAISAGMNGAWVRRSKEAIFDPWGIEPTLTVESLEGLHEKIDYHVHKH